MTDPAPQRVEVLGASMAYRTVGDGPPIVFLHGNPTSSYLWRRVLPRVAGRGRCLAPDLIGMGGSDKRPGGGDGRYRFTEHRRYLDAFLEALAVREGVTFVGHDWGAVLAFDWARRHPSAVRGIAYLETLVAPVTSTGPNAPDPELFGPLRAATGEQLVLQENFFVEQVLPAGTMRSLTPDELDTYRAPYLAEGEGRRPTLTWAREIPLDGHPSDVHDVVQANRDFMAGSAVPKLLVRGEPGALLTGPLLELCRAWPNQTEVVVPGTHFLPEDSPDLIGAALSEWLETLPPG